MADMDAHLSSRVPAQAIRPIGRRAPSRGLAQRLPQQDPGSTRLCASPGDAGGKVHGSKSAFIGPSNSPLLVSKFWQMNALNPALIGP